MASSEKSVFEHAFAFIVGIISRKIAAAKNHYDALLLPITATNNDIKARWQLLSFIYHPDTARQHAQTTIDPNAITRLNEAYGVLKNRQKKQEYDTSSEAQSQQPAPSVSPDNTSDPEYSGLSGLEEMYFQTFFDTYRAMTRNPSPQKPVAPRTTSRTERKKTPHNRENVQQAIQSLANPKATIIQIINAVGSLEIHFKSKNYTDNEVPKQINLSQLLSTLKKIYRYLSKPDEVLKLIQSLPSWHDIDLKVWYELRHHGLIVVSQAWQEVELPPPIKKRYQEYEAKRQQS